MKWLSAVGLGMSTYNTWGSMRMLSMTSMWNSATFYDNDYKALVCLFLSGGNDSYNMLVPLDNRAYNDYATTRSELALDKSKLLKINPLNTRGKKYGLHPSLQNMQQLFESRHLAFLVNIGALIQPTEPEEVRKKSVPLPLGLFSHSDQQKHWMTAMPHRRTSVGWGGRIADRMRDVNPDNSISMNISISGSNIFQQGESTIEFTVSPRGNTFGYYNYGKEDYWRYYVDYSRGIDSLSEARYNDLFRDTYAGIMRNARDAYILFSEALHSIDPISTAFPESRLGDAMKRIVEIIQANKVLGFRRQIFFVRMGGWDNHDELLNNHEDNLRVVDQAVGAFWQALEEINATQNVVLFNMTEFARTLTSNGNGTDHAWGGNVFVLGGPVRGKRIYGEYPSLALKADRMIYRQALVPTRSIDEYFAELAKWFGMHDSDIHEIFPNLSNFHEMRRGLPFGFLQV